MTTKFTDKSRSKCQAKENLVETGFKKKSKSPCCGTPTDEDIDFGLNKKEFDNLSKHVQNSACEGGSEGDLG